MLGIAKLPPHCTYIPYQDEQTALEADPAKSIYYKSLDGKWKFRLFKNPFVCPAGFSKPDFNDSSWADIKVPGNWELQGFGVPILEAFDIVAKTSGNLVIEKGLYHVKDEIKGYLPYTEEQIKYVREILEKRKERIETELDYLNMNEMFYNKMDTDFERELRKQKLDEFLKQIYEKNSIDKLLTTRDGFLTIPVVPLKFEEEIKNLKTKVKELKNKLKEEKNHMKELREKIQILLAEREKYFVPLTFYNVSKSFSYIDEDRTLFVNLDYDSEYGIKGKISHDKYIII